jgi:hypothetical protein
MTAVTAHDQMTRDGGYLMSDGHDGPPTTTVAIIGAGFGGICDAGNYDIYPLLEARPRTAPDAANTTAK